MMKRGLLRVSLHFFVLTALGSTAAQAQIFTPTYLSPVRSSDFGVYVSDGPGEFAAEGIWRNGFGGFDLGFRGGVADTDDLSILLGLDYRRPIAVGAPLVIALTGAGQAVLGDGSAGGFMAGVTLGGNLDSPGVTFIPYVHPRVGLINLVGDEWDLELLGDIGFDIRLRRLDIRFGATFDDVGGDWGVGLAWR